MYNPLAFDDERLQTGTSSAQTQCELVVLEELNSSITTSLDDDSLKSDLHIKYIKKGLNGLSGSFVSLDASKPWLLYWMVHSLDLLHVHLENSEKQSIIDTLIPYQSKTGGFGGGCGQLSHLATTYATVSVLSILELEQGYNIIDRAAMYSWILSLKNNDGSFIMHHGGEIDVRGSYCVMVICTLLGILTPEITKDMASYIKRCQTYEGGISAGPNLEAHGGYTYCALAAMELLGCVEEFDIKQLLLWTTSRQMAIEGGFQGRTNKLVDGCYSFWVGAIYPIIGLYSIGGLCANEFFDRYALQLYLINCCQGQKGGLRDKPGKSVDYYHTCYCLSGLSISQYWYEKSHVGDYNSKNERFSDFTLRATHPVYNTALGHSTRMINYFTNLYKER